MVRSRLSRNYEKKSLKKLFLSLFGIVVVLFLLVKFGLPALINFSLFLSGIHNNQSTSSGSGNSIILPPVLTQTFTATNSATVTITGSAMPKGLVQLFVNDDLVGTANAKDDGTFAFLNIALSKDTNTIRARVRKDSLLSDYSESISILYKNTPPTLSIDNPGDNATFSKDQTTITVSGKTDPDIRVTVNDFWAIVDDKGNYSYSLKLSSGDNQIKVVATDIAGNKTEKDITVHSSQ